MTPQRNVRPLENRPGADGEILRALVAAVITASANGDPVAQSADRAAAPFGPEPGFKVSPRRFLIGKHGEQLGSADGDFVVVHGLLRVREMHRLRAVCCRDLQLFFNHLFYSVLCCLDRDTPVLVIEVRRERLESFIIEQSKSKHRASDRREIPLPDFDLPVTSLMADGNHELPLDWLAYTPILAENAKGVKYNISHEIPVKNQ